MPSTLPLCYRKTWIALAACAALLPHAAWSLDLAHAPPGTVSPYVAPNVIISIDDSGSMNFRIDNGNAGQQSITAPGANGVWDNRAARVNILKYALDQVFSDTTLLPDNKIRLAWQAMHNNARSPGAKNVNSASMQENSMRPLDGTHRSNFLKFVKNIKPNSGTPTHAMLKQADEYMRRSLGTNSPWASIPGKQGAPYLACRRNYHIVFTDGRWNGTVSGGSRDNNAVGYVLPDGTVYHVAYVEEGQLSVGNTVQISVNETRKLASARNHTATHLLQAALKQVVGSQINQAGSSVTPERLRFDFTNFEPVSAQQLADVEEVVNTEIL